MNRSEVIEQPTTEEAKPSTPRSEIVARIREAYMPQSSKKLAKKLLERNLLLGDTFHMTFGLLRQLSHSADNLEVTKHLRRLRDKGLITYTIHHQSQQVAVKFVVEATQETT